MPNDSKRNMNLEDGKEIGIEGCSLRLVYNIWARELQIPPPPTSYLLHFIIYLGKPACTLICGRREYVAQKTLFINLNMLTI